MPRRKSTTTKPAKLTPRLRRERRAARRASDLASDLLSEIAKSGFKAHATKLGTISLRPIAPANASAGTPVPARVDLSLVNRIIALRTELAHTLLANKKSQHIELFESPKLNLSQWDYCPVCCKTLKNLQPSEAWLKANEKEEKLRASRAPSRTDRRRLEAITSSPATSIHAPAVVTTKPVGDAESIQAFVGECCLLGPEHSILFEDLYQLFYDWCIKVDRRPSQRAWFIRSLLSVFPNLTKAEVPRKRKNPLLGLTGIGVVGVSPLPAAKPAKLPVIVKNAIQLTLRIASLRHLKRPIKLEELVNPGKSLGPLGKTAIPLLKNGILTSTRGVAGGYSLGRSASRIAFIDIINATETPFEIGDRLFLNRSIADTDDATLQQLNAFFLQVIDERYVGTSTLRPSEAGAGRPLVRKNDVTKSEWRSLRDQAIIALKAGKSISDVAAAVGVCRASVNHWQANMAKAEAPEAPETPTISPAI